MAAKQDITPDADPAKRVTSGTPSSDAGLSEAAKIWLRDNAEAIKSMNDRVDKHGLPLAKHRLF